MKAPGIRMWAVGAAVLFLFVGGGTPDVRAKVPVPQPPKYPWFEAKNVCLFRLGSGPMPQNSHELSEAMWRGWIRAFDFPHPSTVVKVEQPAFPRIGALRVNLSDGRFKPSARNDEIELNNRIEREVHVGTLEVRGEPLLIRDARFHMVMSAQNATMALERDRTGRPVMMLEDARSGSLSFVVSVADIENLMLADAQEGLGRFGVDVDDMELKIVTETSREVSVTLHIAMEIGFVPAGITFKAHIAVDDAMNAKVSGLSVEGDDVLGPLVANFMRPQLVQHNNETRPLVGFPMGKIKLRDVSMRVDDCMRLEAAFGD